MARKDFDRFFLEAVDEALASIGESARQAIYFHLEDKFKIARDEFPNSVEDFAEGLEKIFGVGARFIEILIMRKLHEKIGQRLEWNENKELVFSEYVVAARQTFMRKRKES